jgi:LmbE family N-acetylglucosaminyl deacetylase
MSLNMAVAFPRSFRRAPALRRTIRRSLRRLFVWGLARRGSPYPLEQDARLVVIAPHPDDGSFACGGLILLKRLEGAEVSVIYLTDGAASHPGHPDVAPVQLSKIRCREERTAAATLGLDLENLTFLAEPDGTLDHLIAERRSALIARIATALRVARPDHLFLPCRRDGSSEHEAGFNLVMAAVAAAAIAPRVFEYPIWAWWAPLRLAEPLLRAGKVWRVDHSGYQPVKAAALAAYVSQLEPTAPWPEPVLSREFAGAFASPHEYFFEWEPR